MVLEVGSLYQHIAHHRLSSFVYDQHFRGVQQKGMAIVFALDTVY
jgi:hypothetical protein